MAELENLTGEYEYLSDYGTGKLMIQKSSNGYDISDYESESSCRFLAEHLRFCKICIHSILQNQAIPDQKWLLLRYPPPIL